MRVLRERWTRQSSAYADVQIELTRMTFHKLLPTVLLSASGLLGTVVLLARHYNDLGEWKIAGIILAACTLRVAVIGSFTPRRSRALTQVTAVRWQFLYATATLLYCSSMALTTLYNFRFHNQEAWTLCMVGTFSLSAGLGSRLGVRPWITQASGIIMLAALSFSLAHVEVPVVRFGAVLILFFAYAHCESVRHKFRIVVEQLRMRRQLHDLVEQDALTGLASRRRFLNALASIAEQSTSFAVLYIDLDKFKHVNDNYGHLAGDTLLQLVAARLQSVAQPADLVARLGGDEFAILHALNATEISAQSLATRINFAIAEPFSVGQLRLCIGASVGIRLSDGTTDPSRLLSEADEALYRVKQIGGSSFHFAVSEDLLLAN